MTWLVLAPVHVQLHCQHNIGIIIEYRNSNSLVVMSFWAHPPPLIPQRTKLWDRRNNTLIGARDIWSSKKHVARTREAVEGCIVWSSWAERLSDLAGPPPPDRQVGHCRRKWSDGGGHSASKQPYLRPDAFKLFYIIYMRICMFTVHVRTDSNVWTF